MSLFQSEIVIKEMKEMENLYMKLMNKVPYFGIMTQEQREEVCDGLEELIDKQEMLYSRAYLMRGDPDGESVIENFKKAAVSMGIPSEQVGLPIFKEAKRAISQMRENLDKML
tara:strand:+ start:2629 stop:2967 length:339 start_codon:yes stop_codon:yes gene_type:complete